MPITIHDLAIYRGMKDDGSDLFPAGGYTEVGLSMMGGCGYCYANLAAYNGYPSKSGFWCCYDCIGDDGFETVEDANEAIFGVRQP